MKKYTYKHNFNVRYCDVDFRDELKPSTLLAYLEEAACYSADELGYGYQYVNSRGLAFVVSNVCCEFLKPVRLFDKEVSVRTWPLPPSYVVFQREYQLCVGDEVAVNASSRWCLLDLVSGKIAPSKRIEGQDYSTYNTDKAFEVQQWKIQSFSVENMQPHFSIKIANSEYDHNFHVNNTKYADYCFNVFTLSELQAWSLQYFAISYVKQCHEGDVLRFYRQESSEKSYLVQGVNDKQEIVVQAEIRFA
ncbi:MAG: hypothetical protein IJF39_04490 [Clostridia bacterium]|nr:hypothetical protein [Clostridia bacterium]